MSDVVKTTGRPMTKVLQEALDDLTGPVRRRVIVALSESESTPLGRLHRALALELSLCELRETDTLQRMSADLVDVSSDPPLLRATGPAWFPEDDTPPDVA